MLNGNHESMNVAGQYRYVTRGAMHRCVGQGWVRCVLAGHAAMWRSLQVCCASMVIVSCPRHTPPHALLQLQGMAAQPHPGGSTEGALRVHRVGSGAARAAADAARGGGRRRAPGAAGPHGGGGTHHSAATRRRGHAPLPGAQPCGAAGAGWLAAGCCAKAQDDHALKRGTSRRRCCTLAPILAELAAGLRREA